MSSDNLKVPFSLDLLGNEVRPLEAERDRARRGEYVCPDCRGVLNLRRGPKYPAHFSHKATPSHCDFYLNETEEHLRAKQSVVRAVERRESIYLIRACAALGCRANGSSTYPGDDHPSKHGI